MDQSQATPLPVDQAALNKLMLLLENDAAALGWDQPARLYAIVGTPEDPRFDVLVEMVDGHPCDILQAMYDDGARLRPEVIGLALSNEGWRHLHLKELEKVDPALVEKMREGVKIIAAATGTPGDTEKLLETSYADFMLRMPRVSQMPPHLRVEVRNVSATFRDGTTTGVLRDRDGEPEMLDTYGLDQALRARVPTHLWKFLNNERPEDD